MEQGFLFPVLAVLLHAYPIAKFDIEKIERIEKNLHDFANELANIALT